MRWRPRRLAQNTRAPPRPRGSAARLELVLTGRRPAHEIEGQDVAPHQEARTATGVVAALPEGNAVWTAIPDPALGSPAKADGSARSSAPLDKPEETAPLVSESATEVARHGATRHEVGSAPSVVASVRRPVRRPAPYVRPVKMVALDALALFAPPKVC